MTLIPTASFNWSGYVATGGTFSGVGATWTVPQLQPTNSQNFLAADATWIGIGGINTRDLIQAGTQAILTPSGQVQLEAWIEKLPGASKAIPLTISAGDSISATIEQQSSNQWNIVLSTHFWRFS